MPTILAAKQRRIIAVLATVSLVIQSFLPGSFLGVSPAQAATATFNFTTAGNYGTDNGTTIHNDTAHFLMTWDTGNGDVASSTDTRDLFSQSTTSGLIWAATTKGVDNVYKSTDYGATWAQNTIDNTFDAYEFVLTNGDSTVDYLVVGTSQTLTSGYAYTTNDGSSWTYATGSLDTQFENATHDSTDNYTWALELNGDVQRSTDGGINWTDQGNTGLDVGGDILWTNADTVWAAGGLSSSGAIYFSTDAGSNWTATSLPGSPPATIDTLGVNDGKLYAAGSGYVATVLLASDPTSSGNWVNISSNINSGNFTTVWEFLSTANIMFVTLQDTTDSEPRIYSTIDNGTTWLEHSDPGNDFATGAALVRLDNGYLLWGVTNTISSNATVYTSQHYAAGDAVITLSGVTATELTSIDLAYHTNNEAGADFAVAIGFSTGQTDTWWYWDEDAGTPAWASSTTDSFLYASGESDLDDKLNLFDDDVGITGDIYLKIYLHKDEDAVAIDPFSYPFAILESVTLAYIPGTITVTSPPAGVVWHIGSSQNITWTDDFSPSSVVISYSINSGGSWTTIESSWTSGSPYLWLIPNDPSNGATAQIRVVSGSVTGTSGLFTIQQNVGDNTNDTTPPYSWVDELPEYTLTPQFDVKVTAYDELGGSGLEKVSLYFGSEYESPVYLWGTWDIMDPDAPLIEGGKIVFNFDTKDPKAWGDGAYVFYSTAEDFAGNSNQDEKRIDPPPPPPGFIWPPPPDVEAFTTVDTTIPYLVKSKPDYEQEEVPINLIKNKITLELSESMNKDSFTYEFDDSQGNSVKDKMEDPPKWKKTKKYGADSKVEIKLKKKEVLEYNTWYTFDFYVQDVAGNELDESIVFKTRPVIHPDITPSTIEVGDGPNDDGSYKVGDVARYIVTLRNASDQDPAATANAELTFAPGITYQAGSLILIDPYNPGNSEVSLTYEDEDSNGELIGFIWTGIIPKNAMEGGSNQVITIFFKATVDEPANDLEIEQDINIYDEVWFRHSDNTPYNPEPAVLVVAEDPDFSTSIKTVDKEEAVAGDVLNYTLMITNDIPGKTASSVKVTDVIPTYTTYVTGSLTGSASWDTLVYQGGSIEATANLIPLGTTYEIGFSVAIDSTAGGATVINTAIINNLDGSLEPFLIKAQTTVYGSPPPDWPPEINYQFPVANNQNVPLKSSIQIGFSKTMNPDSFKYNVKLGEYELDTSGWEIAWSSDYKIVTLTPPIDLEMGATYTVEIEDVEDNNGNPLADGSLPNPWSFTTADPTVKIISPEELLVEIPVDTVSPKFVIELQDAISGQPYKVEDSSVTIGLDSSSDTGRFGLSPGAFGGNINYVTIQQNASQAYFYYIDSTVSLPNYVTITVFENPSRGWADSEKYIVITGEKENLTDRLTMSISSTNIFVNQFSPAMIIRAKEGGKQTNLPERLYFHTQSTTGAFYDSAFNRLDDRIIVQGINPSANLQSFTPSFGMRAATFYYLDTQVGSYIVTASDNAPLAPDTGFDNASAVLNIAEVLIDQELEEDLEEVEDDTGRIIEEVRIKPTQAILLPGGIQTFEATGRDSEGKVIENLIFRWYVIGGGGTIEKEGIANNSHQSAFTAGNDLGMFYDTVLVATLYNGKIGFATANVIVTDVVEYGGPARLPTTGISGLQLIFLGLTLAAAVALAWVTSYEKTHFREEGE